MEQLNNNINQILAWIKADDLKSLKSYLKELEPAVIANLVEQLNEEPQAVVYRLLPKDTALEVFEELDVDLQQTLIQSFRIDKAAEYFRFLEPDDKAALMDELPAKVARLLLSRIPKEDHDMVMLLMGYEDGTAGRMMTPKYYRFTPDMTVAQALEKIRNSKEDVEAIYHLYVTDAKRLLLGEILLRDLIFEDADKQLNQIMTKDPISVLATMDDDDVASILQEYDLLAIPVVDNEHRLIGVVTVDDAMDVLEDERIDQALDKAGLIELSSRESDRSRLLTSGSLVDVWKIRIPFLVITLVGGLSAGIILEGFESALAIVQLAFFIPMIMAMGGNVGTQSSTIFTRALVLGQINVKQFMNHFIRELVVGVSIGLILTIPAGLFIFVWQGDLNLAFVVASALLSAIIIGSSLGYVVPYGLMKLGLDQAAGADPIIMTIIDVTGISIYFLLATLFYL
jgi:magnesium transporter